MSKKIQVSVYYVCESQFRVVDKIDPNYAFEEIDIYAFTKEEDNHRLTLKYNITNKEYELWKYYNNLRITPMPMGEFEGKIIMGVAISNVISDKSEIHYKSPILSDVLNEATQLWNLYHGTPDYRHELKECTHKYPAKITFCKMESDIRG